MIPAWCGIWMFCLEQPGSGHPAKTLAGGANNLVSQQATSLTLCALPHARLVQYIDHGLQNGPAEFATNKSLVMCHPCLGPAGHGKMAHNAFQTWLRWKGL